MEYRFEALEDYLTGSKGGTGISTDGPVIRRLN